MEEGRNSNSSWFDDIELDGDEEDVPLMDNNYNNNEILYRNNDNRKVLRKRQTLKERIKNLFYFLIVTSFILLALEGAIKVLDKKEQKMKSIQNKDQKVSVSSNHQHKSVEYNNPRDEIMINNHNVDSARFDSSSGSSDPTSSSDSIDSSNDNIESMNDESNQPKESSSDSIDSSSNDSSSKDISNFDDDKDNVDSVKDNAENIPEIVAACARWPRIDFEKLLRTVAGASSLCDKEHEFCQCKSTVRPRFPNGTGYYVNHWHSAFARNIQIVQNTTQPLDVIMVGDSITEHLMGTDLGVEEEDWPNHKAVFDEYFSKEMGGSMEGLALGIGGDRCGHLLYRIQNGEVPDFIDPKVWWVLIGTNDLGADHCSVKSIVAGNIRIAVELLLLRPNSQVVLNSILPRTRTKLGRLEDSPLVWEHISDINQMLACFAAKTPGVSFFNATDLFMSNNVNNDNEDDNDNDSNFSSGTISNGKKIGTYTNTTLFADPVHPSELGSRVWCEAIVNHVQQITTTES